MPAEKTESAFCVLKKSNLDVKINQEPRVQARLKIKMHLGDKEPNYMPWCVKDTLRE